MEKFLNLDSLSMNCYWFILIALLLIFVFLLIWLFFRLKKDKFKQPDGVEQGDEIVNQKEGGIIEEGDEGKKKNWGTIIIGIFAGIVGVFLIIVIFLFSTNINYSASDKNDIDLNKDDSELTGEIHYLGILPLENPSTMLGRFAGVEKYLRDETGLNIKLRLYPTSGELGGYTAVVRDVANGNISFAYLASVTTVQANGNGPVIPFVCAQNGGSPTYQGDLAVKVDSPYKTLEDLKGKKVSGTSISSTSGNLMPSAMLKQRGIDQETYFDGGMMYLGSHDKATQAVLAGTIDGCFINEATFNKYNADGVILRSIWRHDPVPEFPFVVNTEKVTSSELAEVKDALLRMHEENIEGIQSANVKYEKWVAIDWEDYLGIKEAIDEVYGPVFYDLEEWGKD